MPVISNNTSRISQKTALVYTSEESKFAKNKAEETLNGVSPSEQNSTPIQLTGEDYKNIGQSQTQNGQFASNYNNNNYSINTNGNPNEFCYAKDAEKNMCENTYDATVISEVEDRKAVVLTDISSKPDIIDPTNFGENSVSNSNSSIQNNNSLYASYQNILTIGQISNLEKQKAKVSSSNVNSTLGQSFMVLIKEERVIVDGQYTSEPITIPIYQTPMGGFQFGTQQVFDPVEPRGSQSPMRFYNKNPGRTLTFGVQLHQQEYPNTPLLIIAEALQELARPYQHTDYSLIPKVVQVLVPGRTFRCYLESVRITSQGEDYQSWQNDDINGTMSSSNEATREMWKKYKYNVLDGNPELKGLSSSTRAKTPVTLHYGLSSLSCDLSFIILEEIKLVEYTSNLEFMAIQVEENNLKLNKQYEEALSAVGGDQNDVVVDKLTGEVIWPVRNENGEWVFVETDLLNKDSILNSNPNAMTLQQFKNQNDNSSNQNRNPLIDDTNISISSEEILSTASTADKITLIIKAQRINGNTLVNDDGTQKSYSLEELQNLSDEKIEELFFNNVVKNMSDSEKELNVINEKFISYSNQDETGYAESTLKGNETIIRLFNPETPGSINEIEDFVKKYVAIELGIEGDGKDTGDWEFTPITYNKNKEIEIVDDNGYKEEVYEIWSLNYPNGIYVIDTYTGNDELGYSFYGTVNKMDRFKEGVKKKYSNPPISDSRIEEFCQNLRKATFTKTKNSWITFGEMFEDFESFKSDLVIRTSSGHSYDISEFVIEDFQALVPNIRNNIKLFLSEDSIKRVKAVKIYSTNSTNTYIPTEKNILYYKTFDITGKNFSLELQEWHKDYR